MHIEECQVIQLAQLSPTAPLPHRCSMASTSALHLQVERLIVCQLLTSPRVGISKHIPLREGQRSIETTGRVPTGHISSIDSW